MKSLIEKIQYKIRLALGFIIISFLFAETGLHAQNVGINSTGVIPNASALLDVDATDKGILIPRISLSSTTDVTTIATPATNLLVFNTNTGMTNGNGTGFYYYNGSSWTYMVAPANGPGVSGEVLTSQGGGSAPEWASTGGDCFPTEITNELDGSGNPCSGTGCGVGTDMVTCVDNCNNLTYNGNSDWRVPSVVELFSLRTIAPGNTSSNRLWTPSIMDDNRYFNVRLSDMGLDKGDINGPRQCRCIR